MPSQRVLDGLGAVNAALAEAEAVTRAFSALVADASDPPPWVHAVFMQVDRVQRAFEDLEQAVYAEVPSGKA